MDGHRWGFEEAEDWEFEEPQETAPPSGEDFDTPVLVGQDPDAMVAVQVTPAAEVLSVKLADGWRQAVDPRGLHANVVAAANTATMQALARQVEEVQQNPPTPTFGNGQNARRTRVRWALKTSFASPMPCRSNSNGSLSRRRP